MTADTAALRRDHYDYDCDGHCDDCGERHPCTVRALVTALRDAQAEVDACEGCGSSLTRCLRWHADKGGKCCPDCKHPDEARGFALLRAERATARAQVAAVLASLSEIEALKAAALAVPNGDAHFEFLASIAAKAYDDALRIVRAAVAAATPTPTRPGDDEVTR